MIAEIHGFPGSGKTTVLTMVAQKLLSGKSCLGFEPRQHIYTSFPCPNCYKLNPLELGKINIFDSVLIIDEISAFFDNRNYKNLSIDTMMFFKLSRHYRCDLLYASQNPNDADLKIRSLVSTTYIAQKYGVFTAIKPIFKFHTLINGQPDTGYEIAPPVAWYWCYRPKYYKFFDSYDAPKLPDYLPEKWECTIK